MTIPLEQNAQPLLELDEDEDELEEELEVGRTHLIVSGVHNVTF